jgi:phosphatidylglycerol lysyltransferase
MSITAESERDFLRLPMVDESSSGSGLLLALGERQAEIRERIQRVIKDAKCRCLIALFVAILTLASGLLNLFSVMGGPSYPDIFNKIFPLELVRLARTLTLLLGFALTLSSVNIYARKKRAWMVVLALSWISTIFHTVRGHYQEAFVFLVLVGILFVTRRTFSVRSSVPDLWGTLLRLLIAGAVAIGYGSAGFWFLDKRHFGINFHIGDSIGTTVRLLSLGNDPRLIPQTHYAYWFLNSLYLVSITAVVYSGFALFRPVIYHLRTLPRERVLAATIAERYARTSLDYFKLWPDKSYFFSPSRQCFIAYRVGGSVAMALGDPVGPKEEIEPTVCEFVGFCEDNGWSIGLHQTLPDFLPLYRQLHLKKLKIGDDPMVDVGNFTLEGKSKKEFRYKIRQLEGMGIHTQEYAPPVPDNVMAQLKEVSDDWLQIPGRRERTFTLGLFDPSYVRSTPVLAAVDRDGKVLGFMNLISILNQKEISMDLMRRRTDAPNGIMEYLFVKLFLYAKEHGFERVNLGMAPMAGFHEREHATAEERAIHGFFQQLNFLFSFRGLRQYKAKFATSWEPRYLVYRHALELPRVALALRRVSELKDETHNEGRP